MRFAGGKTMKIANFIGVMLFWVFLWGVFFTFGLQSAYWLLF